MFPAFLLKFYTPKLFDSSLLEETPVKKQSKVKKRRRRHNRHSRDDDQDCSRVPCQIGDCLSHENLTALMKEIRLTERIKSTFWQTFCHLKRFCGKRRAFKMQKLAV